MLLSLRQQTFTLELWKWIDSTTRIFFRLCRVGLKVSEQCPWESYENIKERTRHSRGGFLWQVYKPLSDFWSETAVPLKITEPKQPNPDNCPWDQLITSHTVAALPIIESLPKYSCRSHYYTHTASVNIQTLLDIMSCKQSPHKL